MVELNKVYVYKQNSRNMFFIFKDTIDEFYVTDIISVDYNISASNVMSDRLISSDPDYYLYKELKPADPMSFRQVMTLCFILPFDN